MGHKVNLDEINKVTQKILHAVGDQPNRVDYRIRKSFYFKGRKSESIATSIIQSLTNPGDKILDPFMGGGSFVIGAVAANRFIYGIELDNYTYSIVKTLFTKSDFTKLDSMFLKISKLCKAEILNLYKTKCCNKKNYIKKLLFDPQDNEFFSPTKNREIKDGKNIIFLEPCSVCGNSTKQFEDYDKNIIDKLQDYDTSRFPNVNYIENSRINITASTGANKYNRIFTKRNQYALLLLQDAILTLPASIERDILEHALVSSLALARIAMYGSSTDILYHVVPFGGQEMNVWYLFESNLKDIVNFKKSYSSMQVKDISNNDLFKLTQGDYAQVLMNKSIPKVDMIYTDFPYTDQVPYLERNQLFRIWLETFYDQDQFKLTHDMLENEIVLTNAPARHSKNSIEKYYEDVDNMFKHLSNSIKTGKYAVFTIKLGKKKYIKTYSQIVNLARKNGFELVTRIGLTNTDPTLRKQSAYANTFMNEIVVVFKKLEPEKAYWYLGNMNYEFHASKIVYDYLKKHSLEKPITLTETAELVLNDMKSKKIHPTRTDEKNILKVLSDNFYVDRGYINIDSNKLYLDIEDNTTLFTKLYDLIPVYIRKLLDEKGKFVLEDLYLNITNALCNGDPSSIAQIIEDETYHRSIKMLLNNYCEISNGFYIQKTYDFKINKDSQDISQFTGTEFELLMHELLIREGYIDIINTGGPGDRGVDLIASKLVQGDVEKTFFQCKRWLSNVGAEPIQRLFAERELHNFDKAICITTSGFTSDGIKAANDFTVEMWTGEKVLQLLDKHFPGKYYNGALTL